MQKRREYGQQYSFISIANFKVCTTHDWRFESDNEKWDAGNYFSYNEACDLFSNIFDKYGKKVEALKSAREINRDLFIRACCTCAGAAKGAKDEKKDEILKKLVEVHKTYVDTYTKLNAEKAEVNAAITEMIHNYNPKNK